MRITIFHSTPRAIQNNVWMVTKDALCTPANVVTHTLYVLNSKDNKTVWYGLYRGEVYIT